MRIDMALRVMAIVCALLAAGTAYAQTDYEKLTRAYVDAFRVLGRAKECRVDFDAEPYFREVARRHGENGELARVARLAFAAGAGESRLPPELEPVLPAPMPCDVIPYMKGMRLPELPASLKAP